MTDEHETFASPPPLSEAGQLVWNLNAMTPDALLDFMNQQNRVCQDALALFGTRSAAAGHFLYVPLGEDPFTQFSVAQSVAEVRGIFPDLGQTQSSES